MASAGVTGGLFQFEPGLGQGSDGHGIDSCGQHIRQAGMARQAGIVGLNPRDSGGCAGDDSHQFDAIRRLDEGRMKMTPSGAIADSSDLHENLLLLASGCKLHSGSVGQDGCTKPDLIEAHHTLSGVMISSGTTR